MKNFEEFLAGIDHPDQRERTQEILEWVSENYPQLETVIKWNQPMFTDHGTFIIGFSVSKQHLAVSPENAGITHCEEEIKQAGYDYTKGIVRIPWNKSVDYSLLEKMIEFNRMDKVDFTKFWR